MPEEFTPSAIACAFTVAWTSHDLTTAGAYVADDVIFDGPLGHRDGKQAYMESLNTLAQMVTGLKIVAAFGDATQALIMYELITDQFGVLTCAKLFSIRDGKIQTDRLTFDSFPMRKSQGG